MNQISPPKNSLMRWTEISTNKYFADSYALIEMFKGNPQYKAYQDADHVCLQVNLAECVYAFLKAHAFQKRMIDELSSVIIPLTTTATITAMNIKYRLRKKKLSYIDCLGYATARELNILFLTGDKEFKDLPGVEFVAGN